MIGGSGGDNGSELKDLLDGMTKQTDEIEELLDKEGDVGDEVMEVPVRFVERQGSLDLFEVGDRRMVPADQVLGLIDDLNRSMDEVLAGVDVEERIRESQEFVEWAENADRISGMGSEE